MGSESDKEMRELFRRAAEIARVVPESMQEAAFNRALDMLNDAEDATFDAVFNGQDAHAAGRPHDAQSQAATLELALRVLETAPAPRTTVQSPQRWSDDPDWKLDFYNIERLSDERIAELRREFNQQKAIARDRRAAEGLETGTGLKPE